MAKVVKEQIDQELIKAKAIIDRIDQDLIKAGIPEVVVFLPDAVADACEFNAGGELTLENGTYYKIEKLSAIEAQMTEVTIREGLVTTKTEHVDVARIILGKLIRKVGDGYGL